MTAWIKEFKEFTVHYKASVNTSSQKLSEPDPDTMRLLTSWLSYQPQYRILGEVHGFC